MAKRAIVAGYVQLVIFPLMTLTDLNLRQEPVIWFGCGLLFLVTVSRQLQLRYGEKVLQLPNGVTLWRIWFAFGAQGIALSWGVATAFAFYKYGLTPKATAMLVVVCGIVALYGASYAFDLLNNWIFQTLMLAPVAIVVMFFVDFPGAISFGICAIGYFAFSINMAHNLNRNEIQLLENVEQLERQDESIRRAHDDLSRKHDLVQAMLGSIDQSFLIFDAEGRCSDNVSATSRAHFGTDAAGMRVDELLELKGRESDNLNSWYRMLFSDRLSFRDVAERGPKQHVPSASKLVLDLKFHPMRDKAGKLSAIIFTATDITRQAHTKKQLAEALERADLILRVRESRSAFANWLRDYQVACEQLKSFNSEDMLQAQQTLHSLKGGASMFGAASLAREIYDIELQMYDRGALTVSEFVRKQGVAVSDALDRWQERESEVLTKLGVFETDTVEISKSKFDEIESEYRSDSAQRALLNEIRSKLLAFEFGDFFRSYSDHVRSLGAKMDKQVRLEVRQVAGPLYVLPDDFKETMRTFIHLFNNAVDHAFETPAERARAGKNPEGHIIVEYERSHSPAGIRLVVKDDGRGIDVTRLRQKFIAKGQAGINEKTDLEIANKIFETGISTRDHVTELSGQGIGMGAVRSAVLKIRGKIQVASTSSSGTVFEIYLPENRRSDKQNQRAA